MGTQGNAPGYTRWRPLATSALLVFSLSCATCTSRVTPPTSAHVVREVPFYPQERGQCGPASLASLLAFFGQPITPEHIAEEIYDPAAGGTTTVAMLAYGVRHALPIDVRHGTLGEIQAEIDAGRPVIALHQRGFPWQDYHFVVVTGYEPTSNDIYGYSGRNPYAHWSADGFAHRWAPAENWMLVWTGGHERVAMHTPYLCAGEEHEPDAYKGDEFPTGLHNFVEVHADLSGRGRIHAALQRP